MKKKKIIKKLFKNKMTLEQAILFLVVGAILGSVFIFGQKYWKAPIDRDSASYVQVKYLSHTQKLVRPDSHAINIHCSNGEIYTIDASCVSFDILDYMNSLTEGTNLDMLVHPNSNTILSLSIDNTDILDFDEVIGKVDFSNTGFMWLGIIMYVLAACGAVRLIFIIIDKNNFRKK